MMEITELVISTSMFGLNKTQICSPFTQRESRVRQSRSGMAAQKDVGGQPLPAALCWSSLACHVMIQMATWLSCIPASRKKEGRRMLLFPLKDTFMKSSYNTQFTKAKCKGARNCGPQYCVSKEEKENKQKIQVTCYFCPTLFLLSHLFMELGRCCL